MYNDYEQFVMLGYGAKNADATNPITLFREYENTMFANDVFDISHFKIIKITHSG